MAKKDKCPKCGAPVEASPAPLPPRHCDACLAEAAEELKWKMVEDVKTLDDMAFWLDDGDDIPLGWEEVAEARGWKLCEGDRDYCTDGHYIVTTNDEGRIVCVPRGEGQP